MRKPTRLILALVLILLHPFCSMGQYENPAPICRYLDIPVSLVTGQPYIFKNDDEATIKAQHIKNIKVMLPRQADMPDSLPSFTAGIARCTKDGEKLVFWSDHYRLKDPDSIEYDANGHLIYYEYINEFEVGCGNTRHPSFISSGITNSYKSDKLQQSVITSTRDEITHNKAAGIAPLAPPRTVQSYYYDNRGLKILEKSFSVNAMFTDSFQQHSSIQYAYDAAGRIRWQLILNEGDDSIPAATLKRAGERIDGMYLRYSMYDYTDSFLALDRAKMPKTASVRQRQQLQQTIDSNTKEEQSILDSIQTHASDWVFCSYNKAGKIIKRARILKYSIPQTVEIDSFIYDKQNRLVCWRTSNLLEHLKEWRFTYNTKAQVVRCAFTEFNGNGFFKPVKGILHRQDRMYTLTYSAENRVSSVVDATPYNNHVPASKPYMVQYDLY